MTQVFVFLCQTLIVFPEFCYVKNNKKSNSAIYLIFQLKPNKKLRYHIGSSIDESTAATSCVPKWIIDWTKKKKQKETIYCRENLHFCGFPPFWNRTLKTSNVNVLRQRTFNRVNAHFSKFIMRCNVISGDVTRNNCLT